MLDILLAHITYKDNTYLAHVWNESGQGAAMHLFHNVCTTSPHTRTMLIATIMQIFNREIIYDELFSYPSYDMHCDAF